jgi:hypothetical protein
MTHYFEIYTNKETSKCCSRIRCLLTNNQVEPTNSPTTLKHNHHQSSRHPHPPSILRHPSYFDTPIIAPHTLRVADTLADRIVSLSAQVCQLNITPTGRRHRRKPALQSKAQQPRLRSSAATLHKLLCSLFRIDYAMQCACG